MNNKPTNINLHGVENASAACFNLNNDGATLTIYTSRPDARVISDFRSGEAKFSLFEYEGVAFFMSNFGANGWLDAPFHAAMNPPGTAGVPDEFVAGKHHLALAVIACDAQSGEQYGARLVTLSKEFSAYLIATAHDQLAVPIGRSEYERVINKAYAAFSASRMAREAVVRCKGGAQEAEESPSLGGDRAAVQRSAVTEFVHVTLDTGQTCVQRTESVGMAARALLMKLIVESRETGWTDLELGDETYPLHIDVKDSNLTCQLCMQFEQGPVPVVTMGVALDPSSSTEFWRELHELPGHGPLLSDPSRPPSAPWIAAVLNEFECLWAAQGPQIPQYFEVLTWAGGFERCMAFAFADFAALESSAS
ncbi:hypothetical protein HHL11_19315 [Ramlibacter sp. G-1-2-2]|uniref:Uncharacterized protein n=1 Tax=Ramlibacter agri TaxID=2728837 RepID=A0A848H5X6_9BURK|nr:hypothetical protein [Ramlibacter agri]NML45907.1 hypothetical protein [Ramlibacter agri]